MKKNSFEEELRIFECEDNFKLKPRLRLNIKGSALKLKMYPECSKENFPMYFQCF